MPTPTSPPALAERLLTWVSHTSFRDHLLGDLHEEYLARHRTPGEHARRWYWSQALRSLPGLLWHRLASLGVRRLALLMVAYVLALVAVSVWDQLVSRQVVQSLAGQADAWPLIVLRVVYFALYSAGALLAGLLASGLLFEPQRSARAHIILVTAPPAVLAGLVMLIQVFAAGRYEQLGYLMFRVTLFTLMLTLGAAAYVWLRGDKAEP
ncbi:MAG: permease prefix domain 2-containing transporter [Pseudomonadota bacterium]